LSCIAVRVNELAAAMIDSAVNGKGSGTLSNRVLRKRGKALLRRGDNS